MGYYTNFQLGYDDPNNGSIPCPTCGNEMDYNWEELITNFVTQEYTKEGYTTYPYNPFEDECKWYEYEEHMRAFSATHSEVLFIVEGRGEDPDDHWRAYFKNGKMQKEVLEPIFPDFDPEKLK